VSARPLSFRSAFGRQVVRKGADGKLLMEKQELRAGTQQLLHKEYVSTRAR
jgi:hypothetical protein